MTNNSEADKIFIGVDVSKSHLDIYVHPAAISAKIENKAKTIEKWLQINALSGTTVVF